MNRVLSTLRWDLVSQYRHGFYFASGFFALVWVALLSQILGESGPGLDLFIPPFMVLNLMITTFYYVGALVLLEKGEGSLAGVAVSPLRDYEYLAAKAGSLTLLALVESLLIVALAAGLPPGWPLLGAGGILLGCFYTLAGFVAIARYDSLNEYLLPSVLFATLLMLPVVDHLGLWRHPLFYLHPVQPALALMRGAYTGLAPWEAAYGLLGSLAWLALGLAAARQRFDRFVVRTAGG